MVFIPIGGNYKPSIWIGYFCQMNEPISVGKGAVTSVMAPEQSHGRLFSDQKTSPRAY
jgi:hypothetical protein